MELAEGWVTQVSPLQIKFTGDTTATAIAWKASGLTFSASPADKVLLVRAPAGWTIIAKVVAT